MKRIVLLGVIGLVTLTGALVLNHYLNREPLDAEPATAATTGVPAVADGAQPSAIEPPPSGTAAEAPATTEPATTEPAGAEQPTAAAPGTTPADGIVRPEAPPVDAAASLSPTFDIVRVNPGGDTVIAGRAEPNAEVTVRDGGKIIGEVKADDRGEWVLVPDGPLASGSRELGLEARSEDGTVRRSASVVILAVPGGPGGGGSGALAVVVPRGELGPSRVLQRPDATWETSSPAAARPDEASTGSTPSKPPVSPHPTVASGKGESAGSGALSLGSIDYDDKGKIALSGTARPGSTVEVEVDDKPLGTTTANRDGEWRMVPEDDMPPGRYMLQVTEKDGANGRELARVRLPFARAEPIGDLPPGTVVVVQPGNSLWRIARNTYGEGMRYTVIFSANAAQIRDPDLIYPGQIFSLPRAD